jgi:O-antigen/teichoic acid export membrane protein
MNGDRDPVVNINYVRETLASIGWKYADVLFGFVGVLVYARVFPQTDFGAAYAVLAAARVVQNFANGVLIGIKKRISEDTRQKSLNQYLLLGLSFIIIFTGASFVVTAIGVEILKIETYSEYVYYGVLSVGARSTFYLSKQIASGMGYPSRSYRIDTIDGAITLFLRVMLWLFAGYGATAILLGEVLSGLLIAVLFLTSMRVFPISIPTIEQIRSLSNFSRWSSINNFSNGLFNQGPIALLGYLVSPVTSAIYKNGVTLSQPGSVLSGAIAGNLVVKVSQDHTTDTDYNKVAQSSVSIAPVVAIPVLFGSLALGDKLMPVAFGKAYTGTGFALVAASTYTLMFSIKKPLYSIANGADTPQIITNVNTLRVFVFLPALGLVMYRYGFTAFLWSTMIVQTIDTLILVYQVRSGTAVSKVFNWSLLGPQIFAGAIMCLLVGAVNMVTDPTGLVSIGVTVLGGAVTYFSVMFLFKSVREKLFVALQVSD